MNAGELCTRVIVSAAPEESIRAVARRMLEYDVGTIVILDGTASGRAVGLVTDRDIAVRCVAKRVDPDERPVSEIMTQPVRKVAATTPIEDALAQMAGAATRRLVVTDERGLPVGILSLDDVLDGLVKEARAIGRLLEKQEPSIPV